MIYASNQEEFTKMLLHSATSNDRDESNSTDDLVTVWDNDIQFCRHALKSLTLLIYYDDINTITDVKADIIWINIGNHSKKSIIQKFEVKFISSTGSDYLDELLRTSNDYHFSSPTLAGSLDGQQIEMSVGGFTIMTSGECAHQVDSTVSILS